MAYLSATSGCRCWIRSCVAGAVDVVGASGGSAVMTNDIAGPADGNARSIGAAEIDGDTGMGCAVAESVGVTVATSMSVPRAC